MLRTIVLIVATALLHSVAALAGNTSLNTSALRTMFEATVTIHGSDGGRAFAGSGTVVHITRRKNHSIVYVVTNQHVTEPFEPRTVKDIDRVVRYAHANEPTVVWHHYSKSGVPKETSLHSGRIIAWDETVDLALITVVVEAEAKLPHIGQLHVQPPKLLDEVIAVGLSGAHGGLRMLRGYVSQLVDTTGDDVVDVLESTAPIHRGHSGGSLWTITNGRPALTGITHMTALQVVNLPTFMDRVSLAMDICSS